MEAGILIQEIKTHGLDIQVIDGNLHVRPRDRITESIRQAIQGQKRALVDFIEAYEERAAIMEFDGGMSRQEAEAEAFKDCVALCGEYKP
ncbi:MAG: hypothetical protein CO093_07530 [Alphaproteobacteria bacterium CG_4_9_14_3_um_filter_47_13]|nr:MAG: hypothetical protein CO093_07530 [Alphaproteobacteria bacterium CG_4_9_14_3_um_filter_47_13]